VRYRITHVTTYTYADLVAVSHNHLHLQPRDDAHQRVERFAVTVTPHPAVSHRRRDYYGNRVDSCTVQEPHQQLTVAATSMVVLSQKRVPAAAETPPWEVARDLWRAARSDAGAEGAGLMGEAVDAVEFAFASTLVPVAPEFAAFAAPAFTPGRPLLAAALELNHRIHADFAYDPQATTVTTPVAEAFARRRGVCQDFAQVMLACLRSLGLSARYVSGYLETRPPPGCERLVGADASHAWISLFCPDHGWIDLDPTNDCLVGDRHITVAHGRDFADVSPIKGVILGGGPHVVSVSVDVLRLDDGGEPAPA
jgi:transglutaminase-like putative cysteine protease